MRNSLDLGLHCCSHSQKPNLDHSCIINVLKNVVMKVQDYAAESHTHGIWFLVNYSLGQLAWKIRFNRNSLGTTRPQDKVSGRFFFFFFKSWTFQTDNRGLFRNPSIHLLKKAYIWTKGCNKCSLDSTTGPESIGMGITDRKWSHGIVL